MTNLSRLMRSCKLLCRGGARVMGSSFPESISCSCGGGACAFFSVSSNHWKNWTSERKSQEKRRMNCSVYSAFFCDSDLLRSLSRGCVPSAFFLGVLMVALLELPSCQSQDHSCGLLGLWPLICLRLKCCPLRYLPDAGPVLVCSLGAGPQSELLLPC